MLVGLVIMLKLHFSSIINVILLSALLPRWGFSLAEPLVPEYKTPLNLTGIIDGDPSFKQEVSGNLLNVAYKEAKKGNPVLIVQGCNCFGFGGGLSAEIGRLLPEAKFVDDEDTRKSGEKLGHYTSADVTRNGVTFKVINGYTQYHGGRARQLSLEENISSVFRKIAKDFPGYRVYYPDIGCGIAGGNWDRIHPIIKQALKGNSATFVRYNPNETAILPEVGSVHDFLKETDYLYHDKNSPQGNEPILKGLSSVELLAVKSFIKALMKKRVG